MEMRRVQRKWRIGLQLKPSRPVGPPGQWAAPLPLPRQQAPHRWGTVVIDRCNAIPGQAPCPDFSPHLAHVCCTVVYLSPTPPLSAATAAAVAAGCIEALQNVTARYKSNEPGATGKGAGE
jgi:hypothetical protein